MTKLLRKIRNKVAAAPAGRHRRVVLLPDEPSPAPAAPVPHAVLDEAELEDQLEREASVVNAFATCPVEGRRTFHAFYRTGVRKCWTCGTSSAGDAIGPTLVRGDS